MSDETQNVTETVPAPEAPVGETLPILPSDSESSRSTDRGLSMESEQNRGSSTRDEVGVGTAPIAEPSQPVPVEMAPSIVEPPVAVPPVPVIPESSKPDSRSLLRKALEVIQFRKKAKFEKIIKFVTANGSVANDQVEKFLHVSDATASRYLAQLIKEGRLKRIGTPEHAHYQLP